MGCRKVVRNDLDGAATPVTRGVYFFTEALAEFQHVNCMIV